MSICEKAKHIFLELKGHAPFTLFGAVLGIAFMLIFSRVGEHGSRVLFGIFHPAHVLLSAMVTASMFGVHQAKKRFWVILLVGYFGSVGIATFSDVVIPHVGAKILGLDMPSHGEVFHGEHGSENAEEHIHSEHERESAERFHIHLGFIEEWYIVNPVAFLGIFIAYYIPRTKFPHAFHVLISTWASSSYLLMSSSGALTVAVAMGAFATLFVATWLPCCISDIVFPLLFVKSDIAFAGTCSMHSHHSHPHEHSGEEPV
jgi:hypothetical protein